MKIARLTPFLSVSPQLGEADLGVAAAQGFRAVVCNRPDGEADDQPLAAALGEAARRLGMDWRQLPVVSGKVTDDDVADFAEAMGELKGPVLAFCRTGTRSATLWALSEAAHLHPDAILQATAAAGYDLEALRSRLETRWRTGELARDAGRAPAPVAATTYDVLVIGGGAAGISVAASLLRRRPGVSVAIVEPRERHYYQPGWTLVGGGAFSRARTERPMAGCIPAGARWIRTAAAAFEPEHNRVVLEDGERIGYRTLVVCPGLKLDWKGVEGLTESLGHNGVTSNYLFDMSGYTWDLVQGLREGTALFSQPPMPIKCAGAPQKAMYLSCDHWRRRGVLDRISVELNTATPVLFGVKEFVPTLMKYVEGYGAKLAFGSVLRAVDGPAKTAWFDIAGADGKVERVAKRFDMLHAVPPQVAPDFVRDSPLAGPGGWVEVSSETLQHARYGNVFSLGDACSAPNAKTAAAVRKQAPTVAANVVAVLDGQAPRAIYDGYGACPLTVERGRVVMAEFGYGGKLAPTFPLDPTKARRSYWFAKTTVMPFLYWDLMLKGREWLAAPQMLPHEPTPHDVPAACDYSAPQSRKTA